MIEFPGNTFGLALNLERDSVGSVIMGDYGHIAEGDTVKCTGRILEVPVGRGLLGRVVNSLGQPIDGKGPIESEGTSPHREGGARRHHPTVGGTAACRRGSSPSTRWCRSGAASAS